MKIAYDAASISRFSCENVRGNAVRVVIPNAATAPATVSGSLVLGELLDQVCHWTALVSGRRIGNMPQVRKPAAD